MALFMLGGVFSDIALSVVNRKQVPSNMKLVINLAQPRRRLRPSDLNDSVIIRATVPGLRQMCLHALRPLFQRYVTHKRSDRHTRPHSPAMRVWLSFSLTTREDDLKAEASVRYGRNSNCQTVDVFSVVVVVRIGELFSNPAFEVWNVAR